MIFANQEAYDSYNNHPVHQNYVATRWLKDVRQFQEIDLIRHT